MTLAQRLNGWYALVLLVTLLLAAGTVELVSSRLAAARRTALIDRMVAEVTHAYRSGGVQAANDVEFPGVALDLRDADGRPLADPDPRLDLQVAVRTRIVQGVWLHTSIPHDVVAETRRDARVALAAGGLLVLALGLAGGLVATRRALHPVRLVTATAGHIVDTGDTGARVPPPGTRDALDEMVRMFNGLLATDERRIEQMRASLDSVGHDLRTPMTRIRASAELALTDGDPAAMAEALATAVEEATASEQLLTRLLDLTRAEAGMLALEREAVAPDTLLDRVVALYAHVAEERGIRLVTSSSGAPPVSVDRTRMEQALANLVDNALKFGPPGSVVRLTVEPDHEHVRFRVADEGPGLPEHEREAAFERLVRGDTSRGTPGAGLGLAMVRAIAAAHGGTAHLEASPSGGAVAVLTIPTARPGTTGAP